jgi:hypothetical protein
MRGPPLAQLKLGVVSVLDLPGLIRTRLYVFIRDRVLGVLLLSEIDSDRFPTADRALLEESRGFALAALGQQAEADGDFAIACDLGLSRACEE